MTEAYRPISKEQEIREQARAEWKAYAPHNQLPVSRVIFFNNMFMKFPGVIEREYPILAAVMPEQMKMHPERRESSEQFHSELYYSHPYGKLFDNVKDIIEKLGLSEKVREMVHGRDLPKTATHEEVMKVTSVYYPIYEELRVIGYSHRDIIE